MDGAIDGRLAAGDGGEWSRGRKLAEVFSAFLRLGLISFGGPVAHLSYYREEFVRRRRWLDDGAYGDLVALCQFLPGPASSQVVLALGMQRAGLAGAVVASLCFTLPSAALMILFGYGVASLASAKVPQIQRARLTASTGIARTVVCLSLDRGSCAFIGICVVRSRRQCWRAGRFFPLSSNWQS